MANPLEIGGTHEQRESWSRLLLARATEETNLWDDFSTDYEQDEVSGIIHVPTRNREVVFTEYDILNGIDLTQSQTEYIPLIPDKHYAANELIDGYEAEAVPDNLAAARLSDAGETLGLMQEGWAIETMLAGGTVSTDTSAITEENAYNIIAAEISTMKKRHFKASQMRCVVDAHTELMLLTNEKFIKSGSTLSERYIQEGVIGKINGVPVKCNYLMGDGVGFMIYDRRFLQKYVVWKRMPFITDIKDGRHVVASALQARIVAGATITNALGVQIRKYDTV